MTTFIGKNDVGKSTIFEALEIFFNNKLVVADNDDFCVHSKSDVFTISCEFSNLPDQIVIDENVSTTLESEYLLNKNGNLTITKYTVGLKPSLKKRFLFTHITPQQ